MTQDPDHSSVRRHEIQQATAGRSALQRLGFDHVTKAIIVLRIAALVAVAFSAATAVDYYGSAPQFCQPGAGCNSVHVWSRRFHIDLVLPALGLIFYSGVLLSSLVGGSRALRYGAVAASVGGVGALGFIIVQKLVIGAWCWLCLGVDSAAVVAAMAAVPLLRVGHVTPPSRSMQAVWSFAWVLAVALPLLWATRTRPSPRAASVVELQVAGKITVTVFTDPVCPFCRLLHRALGEAVSGSDDVALIYVLVPLPIHPMARDASKAVLCAESSGQSIYMRDFVYTTDDLRRSALVSEAEKLGLDSTSFGKCLDSLETEARIVANVALADKSQVEGFPTVYVNGDPIVGYDADRGAEPYRTAIERAREPTQRDGLQH
jgi:predicted DsbA family dithiol-disulfide isomerase